MRTPYGISGEIWGHVIVSCAAQTAEDIDVKELYTMIRASRENLYCGGFSTLSKSPAFARDARCSSCRLRS